jgi:hypothetical protein
MTMAVFCNFEPCNLVLAYRRFGGTWFLHYTGDKFPDNGGSNHLWNVGKLLPHYAAQRAKHHIYIRRRRENLKSHTLHETLKNE